jgi:hypothetical protein
MREAVLKDGTRVYDVLVQASALGSQGRRPANTSNGPMLKCCVQKRGAAPGCQPRGP